MTYYYSGLTKYPTDNQNLFLLNEWGEKVAWRGMFPSAESIGEFYGLILLLLILKMFSHKQISYLEAIFSLFISIPPSINYVPKLPQPLLSEHLHNILCIELVILQY